MDGTPLPLPSGVVISRTSARAASGCGELLRTGYRVPGVMPGPVLRDVAEQAVAADTAAAWTAWFEKMGASVVDLGNPVFDRTAVGKCGPDTDLGGYTLVMADDFDGAVTLAEGCPLLPDGGGVEVGELTPVPGRHHPARDY